VSACSPGGKEEKSADLEWLNDVGECQRDFAPAQDLAVGCAHAGGGGRSVILNGGNPLYPQQTDATRTAPKS
jgi:hypothetical protein